MADRKWHSGKLPIPLPVNFRPLGQRDVPRPEVGLRLLIIDAPSGTRATRAKAAPWARPQRGDSRALRPDIGTAVARDSNRIRACIPESSIRSERQIQDVNEPANLPAGPSHARNR